MDVGEAVMWRNARFYITLSYFLITLQLRGALGVIVKAVSQANQSLSLEFY